MYGMEKCQRVEKKWAGDLRPGCKETGAKMWKWSETEK